MADPNFARELDDFGPGLPAYIRGRRAREALNRGGRTSGEGSAGVLKHYREPGHLERANGHYASEGLGTTPPIDSRHRFRHSPINLSRWQEDGIQFESFGDLGCMA